MPARKKSLRDFVADGTFLARRHAHLLEEEPLVADPALRSLQEAYQETADELGARGLAHEFQSAVKERAGARKQAAGTQLERLLLELGRPGSAAQVINFFPRFLTWDDGSPFVLDTWQRAVLREAYRRDQRRRRIYKEILLGITRGSGKTPIASGISLHALLASQGRPKILQAAGSAEQAGIGLEYGGNWIEDGELGDYLTARAKTIRRRDGRGSYSVVPAAGGLGHGRKPTVSIIDELWLFLHYAQTQTYTAAETALHKHGAEFLFAISTAGHDRTTLLGRMYDSFLKASDVRTFRKGFLTISRDEEAGRLMWWYGMPDGYELDLENRAAVMKAIELANPGSWTDHREIYRALQRMLAKGEELEWLRLYLNHWTKVRKAWIPTGRWPALRSNEEIPAGAPIYVAVDAAYNYDTTACVWAWRAPSGRIVLRAHVWSVREEVPAHTYVDADSLDNEALVEPFVHSLGERYRVKEVVFDPRYFGTEARHLAKRFKTAPLHPQSEDMHIAVQEFYRDVLAGGLAHDGDPVFAAHVEAIAGKREESGWRIRQLLQSQPVDAGSAAIMVRSRAARKKRGGQLRAY